MPTLCDKCGTKLTPKVVSLTERLSSRWGKIRGCCGAVFLQDYDNSDIHHALKKAGEKRLLELDGFRIKYDNDVKYALYSVQEESWMGFFLLYLRSSFKDAHVYRVGENNIGLSYVDEKGRTKKIEGRPVRILRRLLTEDDRKALKDTDYETFHNLFEGRLQTSLFKWRVVQGESIRNWYHHSAYAEGTGALLDSCMGDKECQPYFDIYVKNPKVCRMLTVRSEKDDMLHGRAILWTLANNQVFMDTCYANDLLKPQMRAYAHEKGWITDYTQIRSHVQLSEWQFDSYPYLDTFCHLNVKNGTLHTDRHLDSLTVDERSDYVTLDSTDGTIYNVATERYIESLKPYAEFIFDQAY